MYGLALEVGRDGLSRARPNHSTLAYTRARMECRLGWVRLGYHTNWSAQKLGMGADWAELGCNSYQQELGLEAGQARPYSSI